MVGLSIEVVGLSIEVVVICERIDKVPIAYIVLKATHHFATDSKQLLTMDFSSKLNREPQLGKGKQMIGDRFFL